MKLRIDIDRVTIEAPSARGFDQRTLQAAMARLPRDKAPQTLAGEPVESRLARQLTQLAQGLQKR